MQRCYICDYSPHVPSLFLIGSAESRKNRKLLPDGERFICVHCIHHSRDDSATSYEGLYHTLDPEGLVEGRDEIIQELIPLEEPFT